MEAHVAIKDLGKNVAYISLHTPKAEIGHVMVGRDYANQALGRLIDLDVNSSHRRRGHGRTLVINALRHLSNQGVQLAEVDVVSDNAAALNLYQDLGFTEVAQEKSGDKLYIKMRRSTDID